MLNEWPLLLQAATFGVVLGIGALGVIGIFVPAIPGTLLIWLALLIYGVADGFSNLSLVVFILITVVALISGLADFWLPLLGAKVTGASRRSLVYGGVGSFLGFVLGSFLVIGSLPGAVVGYALGIYAGQYREHQDWRAALKASLGGTVSWGLSTLVQAVGGLFMLGLFAWSVLG
jgi:hypothetical protein